MAAEIRDGRGNCNCNYNGNYNGNGNYDGNFNDNYNTNSNCKRVKERKPASAKPPGTDGG
jgi:hypothetical protein